MKQLEIRGFRPALRLGRRHINVRLGGGKTTTGVWSNYSLSRGLPAPSQRMPRVGHFSTPKSQREV